MLVNLAGPHAVGAGVDERDARGHQPACGQVGAERAVGPAALQQRADYLVRCLVRARGGREHTVQGPGGQALVRPRRLQRGHDPADGALDRRFQQRFPGREVRVHRDPGHARLGGDRRDACVPFPPQQFIGGVQDGLGVPVGDLPVIAGLAFAGRRGPGMGSGGHLSAPPLSCRPRAAPPGLRPPR